MWKCPVCETEYGDVTVCPKCGFDGSCDYERYPTAFTVRNAKSTRALRREWEQKQAPRVDGGNINREIVITPEQAAQGCRITAGYFGGKRVEVTIPANWKDGGLLRCAEQGYPGKNGGKNGDLILTVRVQQPEPAQRQETAQDSLNDALGDLTAALRNVQQAKQAQQQAQQPKQAQPAPAKAPAAKKEFPVWLLIIIAIAAFVFYNKTIKAPTVDCEISYETSSSERNYVRLAVAENGTIEKKKLWELRELLYKNRCYNLHIEGLNRRGQLGKDLLKQVSTLTSVSHLQIYYFQAVEGLDALSESNVYKLTIVDCDSVDLKGLDTLSYLDELSIHSVRQISNWSELAAPSGLKNLKKLNITNSDIRDLPSLDSLTELTRLYLSDNQISDLTPLAGLPQLYSLDISNNQVSDLTPLAGLTKLWSLEISNNQVSSLKPLASLTNLKYLYMENNQVSSLAGLEKLTSLSSIHAAGNPLTDTSALNTTGQKASLYTD